MTKDVKKFKVTIGGESYFLVSDEPEEHLRAVANLVDEQMKSFAQNGHTDDPQRLAVLVALQCASKMIVATELLEKYQAHNEKLLVLITQEVSLAVSGT
jgi:cell division protein ZapA